MYTLPKLNFKFDALEPIISKEIMELHYQKHHQSYVNNINEIITKYDPNLFSITNETTLAMYINTFPIEIREEAKNNLGGHINHSYLWNQLSSEDTTIHKKALEPLIEKHYGSFDTLTQEIKATAKKLFGSGWVWACFNPLTEFIEVRAYQNQHCPFFENMFPLIGIDLWEHAYYLQYKSNKAEYIEKFMTIINWEKVHQLLLSYTTEEECCEEDSCCNEKNSCHK
jgi:Fe-Mn family superoxide dismutase